MPPFDSINTTSPLVRQHERHFLDRIASRLGKTTFLISEARRHERSLLRVMSWRIGVNSDGTQTVILGLPTETDTAIGMAMRLELGLPSETSTALPLAALNNPIPAVIYFGVKDYLKHTGGPAGATDGTVGTFVWSGTFNSDGSAMTLFDIPGTVPVKLERQSDNTIDFVVGTAGAVCSNSTAAVAASLGFLIVLASFSGTTSHLYVIHAAGTIAGTNTAGVGASADLTADWFMGADGGASNFLDADTAMWWADDSFIDFSVSDNREEFWDTTNDLLRDPGSDGSNPSGAQPLVCHVDASASHTTNRGSGGNADAGSNSGDGTSPGTFAADFSGGSGPSMDFGIASNSMYVPVV